MQKAAISTSFDRNYPILSIRSKTDLVDLAVALFESEGSVRALKIDLEVLRRFTCAISRHYHNNAYHNFHHAVDTINTAAWMISRQLMRRKLPALQRYLLLVAALTHDVGHPGHNNQWEVNTESDLARRYDNKSVIENYSLDLTFELVQQPGLDVLQDRKGQPLPQAGEILTDLILATDFAMHRAFLDEFIARLKQGPMDFADPRCLSMVSRALIKAADIANTSKDFAHARFWGHRVMKEFWLQGQREKKFNLPVGPLNDPDSVSVNAAQAGFIKFAALELFDLLAQVDGAFTELADSLRVNLERYERRAEAE